MLLLYNNNMILTTLGIILVLTPFLLVFRFNNRFLGFAYNYLNHNEFYLASCKEKIDLVERHKIKYIYSGQINCDKFIEIGKSSEGLYLYEFKF